MAFTTVVTGQVIQTVDFTQFAQVFNRLPGQSETGHYMVAGQTYIAGAYISTYVSSHSRGPVPVSVSINTADSAPSGLNTPTASNVSYAGFLVKATGTATNLSVNAGGVWTLQY